MINKKKNSLLVAMIAISLSAWASAASSGSSTPIQEAQPVSRPTQYAPIQSIRHDFGSKSVSGYFVERAATCAVMLMVFEKVDTEQVMPPSATRVRLLLNPGQIAGLDSEDGPSINFTCGGGASMLLVDVGDRNRLMELQSVTLPKAQSVTLRRAIAE